MVLQHFVDLLLDLGGNTVEISRPGMAATGALNHYDGETLYEEHAADVLTLGTRNRKLTIGIGHGRVRIVDPSDAYCLDGSATSTEGY